MTTPVVRSTESDADRLAKVFGPDPDRRYLGEADKQAVVRDLHDQHGLSVRQIAERTGISKSAVQRYLAADLSDAVPHGTLAEVDLVDHRSLEEVNADRARRGLEPIPQEVHDDFEEMIRKLEEANDPELWVAAEEITSRAVAKIQAEQRGRRLPSIATAAGRAEQLADQLDQLAERVQERIDEGKDEERDPDAITKAAEAIRLGAEILDYQV